MTARNKANNPGKLRRFSTAILIVVGCLSLIWTAGALPLARSGWIDAIRARIGHPAEPAADHTLVQSESVVAEGRVATYPGAEVIVSSEMVGRVIDVPVTEGQTVRRGDLLATLASSELRPALDEAQAKLTELEADVRLREWKVKRADQLAETHAASARETREFRRDLEIARAQRDYAAATVRRMKAQLSRTRIVAPINGTIVHRAVHPGQMVQHLTPLLTVADLTRTRVEAEVNEFDGGRVRPGASATVTAEGYRNMRWDAEVEEIPAVVLTRQLRPQDPGRPSDTGVVLVKLKLLSPTPLKLGQRVEIRIASPQRAETTRPTENGAHEPYAQAR